MELGRIQLRDGSKSQAGNNLHRETTNNFQSGLHNVSQESTPPSRYDRGDQSGIGSAHASGRVTHQFSSTSSLGYSTENGCWVDKNEIEPLVSSNSVFTLYSRPEDFYEKRNVSLSQTDCSKISISVGIFIIAVIAIVIYFSWSSGDAVNSAPNNSTLI